MNLPPRDIRQLPCAPAAAFQEQGLARQTLERDREIKTVCLSMCECVRVCVCARLCLYRGKIHKLPGPSKYPQIGVKDPKLRARRVQ